MNYWKTNGDVLGVLLHVRSLLLDVYSRKKIPCSVIMWHKIHFPEVLRGVGCPHVDNNEFAYVLPCNE